MEKGKGGWENAGFFNPPHAENLRKVAARAAEERAVASKHKNMDVRCQSVAWQLLPYHAEYIEGLADIMIEKALGNNFTALEKAEAFYDSFGRHEIAIDRYYDHGLATTQIYRTTRKPQKIIM